MRHRPGKFASTEHPLYAYSILCGILSELICHINLAKPDPAGGPFAFLPKHYDRLVC